MGSSSWFLRLLRVLLLVLVLVFVLFLVLILVLVLVHHHHLLRRRRCLLPLLLLLLRFLLRTSEGELCRSYMSRSNYQIQSRELSRAPHIYEMSLASGASTEKRFY